MSKHEATIIKRFEQMIQSANCAEDLIGIDDFISENKGKASLKGIAYNQLLCLLGSEKSTESQIAFAYFITGQTYDNPDFRYLYFTMAGNYFRDLGMSDLFISSLRKKQYALFQIELKETFMED